MHFLQKSHTGQNQQKKLLARKKWKKTEKTKCIKLSAVFDIFKPTKWNNLVVKKNFAPCVKIKAQYLSDDTSLKIVKYGHVQ